MDGDRFDALTRALGSGRSRRSLLKGLGAAAIGAVGLGRAGAARAGSNNTAAHFCTQVFGGDTLAASQCASQAAHGTGPYVACGGNPANYCNGSCTNISTDVRNCGGCGNVCPSNACNSATCSAGHCGATPINCDDHNACTIDTCDANTGCVYTAVACDPGDQCHAPATCAPASGCGATTPLTGPTCTTSLGYPGTCQNGSCVCTPVTSCPAGQTCGTAQNGCGGTIDCGSCGANSSCVSGACACNAGFADCDGDPANGCEADTLTDPNNCGGCGAICGTANTTVATCGNGACQLTCQPLYGDCDGNAANGCEADLIDNPQNCGSCGNNCANVKQQSYCDGASCVCLPDAHDCGDRCVEFCSSITGDYQTQFQYCFANVKPGDCAFCMESLSCWGSLATGTTCGTMSFTICP